MIAIVSSSIRERALLTALCDQYDWPAHPCASFLEFSALTERTRPHTVLTRHRLSDGYSDDILALQRRGAGNARIIVLAPADYSASDEARQVELGADCILRDPVRTEVLMAFLKRFHEADSASPASSPSARYEFAGAEIYPNERRLTRGVRSIQVTPQEIALIRLLRHSEKKVLTYTVIYDELFSRRFEGDTANARVLFGRTARSFAEVGIILREHVEVIAKSGYLYRSRQRTSARKTRSRK